MANPNAIVDTVSQLDPASSALSASAGGVTIYFSGGQYARLDPSDARASVYAEILDELRVAGDPVYVEIDPVSQTVSQLLIPITVKVAAVTPAASGDVEVELDFSHARHVLRAANPDFDQLLDALRNSLAQGTPVIVTETDIEHEIIDVRPSPDPFASAPAREPAREFILTLRAVTPARARELFALVSGRTCDPRTTPPPCIPFLFPDDGCWGRAHEMCNLIIAEGEQPAKVWVYGRLRVRTKNHPDCEVPWGWHVAPTLEVSIGGTTQLQVIDPSLFSESVPEAVWKDVQGSITGTAYTDAAIFYRWANGDTQTDPDNIYTPQVLRTYRVQLKNRSAGRHGPPPYSNCP